MPKILPQKLDKKPIVEAVFEIRFLTELPAASNILLGIFYKKYKGAQIEKLSVSDIPQQVRDSDPVLQYAPLLRTTFDNYSILIGDKVFAIATGLPYQGWTDFKRVILELIDEVKQSNIISVVERFSLKYVNLIEASTTREQLNLLKLELNIGSLSVMKEAVNLRLEIPQDDFINIVQIVSNGVVEDSQGQKKNGIIVSVDSISKGPHNEFWQILPESLEKVHNMDKELFFDFLKEETIKYLDPVYEK